MPVFVRTASAWEEQVPRSRSGGAWTDTTDELRVRTGGAWELIYPDPASVGNLLPVEGLAVTAGPDSSSVTIGWTNPTQPTVEPTDVQVRIAQHGAVWTELDYPITSFVWSALDSSTTYFAQVRLVRRESGVVTETSVTKSVEFTTTAAPVGDPAPDPGGTGGDSTFPINVGIGGGGAGSGDPVGTSDGCWYEWKIEVINTTSGAWEATGLSGTFSGALSEFDYDLATLDSTKVYRLCVRTACDTNSDTVADDFGDWNCGDGFVGVSDWDLTCAGIGDSAAVAGLAAEADATFRFPRICKDSDNVQLMTDAVSGAEVGQGAGFSSTFFDDTGEAGAVPLSTLTSAPFYSLMTAPIATLETDLVGSADWTLMTRFKALSSHSGSDGRTVVIASYGAFAANFQLAESATGWTPSFTCLTNDGIKTVTGTEITFDSGITHTLTARWDDDANLTLFVDGSSSGTPIDVSSITFDGATSSGVVIAQAAGVAALQQLGWDRALSDAEIETFQIGVDSNVLYSGTLTRNPGTLTAWSLPTLSPSANTTTVLIAFQGARGTSPATPSISGGGLSWTQVFDTATRTVGIDRGRVTMWVGASASPGSAAVSITPGGGGDPTDKIAYAAIEFPGADTGSGGAAAFIQEDIDGPTTATETAVTLGAFASASNSTLLVVAGHQAGGTWTPDSPIVELLTESENGGETSLLVKLFVGFADENDTTPRVAFGGSVNYAAIGEEMG